jgi:hypothetical protein
MAIEENISPTNWAKRFGGPATFLFLLPSIGTITRVANKPIGLNLGPVRTLAKNPYVNKKVSQWALLIIIERVIINTINATSLAATSFTG